MGLRSALVTAVGLLGQIPVILSQPYPLETLAEFVQVPFVFGSDAPANAEAEYLAGGFRNATITGVKEWNNRIFLSVPRWRPGVPATLNVLTGSGSSAALDPWPSWAMNRVGNCGAMQYVQSMEIDPTTGLMWVIDNGRINIFAEGLPPNNRCPPQVLRINVDTGEVLSLAVLPEPVVNYSQVFLNDLMIDPLRQVAYITDTAGPGGLIVYWANTGRFRRFTAPSTAAVPGFSFTMAGVMYMASTPSDGIALTPDMSRVFYCPLSSTSLYSVDATILRDESLTVEAWNSALRGSVLDHGRRPGPSDGLTFDSSGTLFFGGLNTTTLYSWIPRTGAGRSSTQALQGVVVEAASVSQLQWIDTFAFGTNGGLVFTTNKLAQFFSPEGLNFSAAASPNFRVLRVANGARSYLFNVATTAAPTSVRPPAATKLSAGDEIGIAVGGLVVLLLGCLIGLYACGGSEKNRGPIESRLVIDGADFLTESLNSADYDS